MNNTSVACYHLTIDNATNKTVEIRVGKFCIRTSSKSFETFKIDKALNYVDIVMPSSLTVTIPSMPSRVYLQHERWNYFFDTTSTPLQFTILETRSRKPVKVRNASNHPLTLVLQGENFEDEIYEKVATKTSVTNSNFLDLAIPREIGGQTRLYITNPCHDVECRFVYPTVYHFESLVINCIDHKEETLIIVMNRTVGS